MCAHWKTIYQYYCREISCAKRYMHFFQLASRFRRIVCRMSSGWLLDSIRIELTERMGAIGLSKNRRTLAVIAVALKSRYLEMCPAFIVLARPANSYVHTCCYYVHHSTFHIRHSYIIYICDGLCVCVCLFVERCGQRR